MNASAKPETAYTPTILVVDDIPINLAVARGALKKRGYRVFEAQDGETALKLAALVKPDLILLDVMMPDMDGFEVCHRLKLDVDTADISVIFMTALSETEHKVTGFKVGGVDYITKPIQVEELIARVETHLKLKTMQRQLLMHQMELEQLVEQRTAQLNDSNKLLREEINARNLTQEKLTLVDFALNHGQDAVFLINEQAGYHYVNEKACVSLGYRRDELLSMGLCDIDPNWNMEDWRASWKNIRTLKSTVIEACHKTKNGQTFPVEISVNYFEYGGDGYNLFVARDITERKQAEKERLAHLHFFESMDRVNRAIQGNSNLEQMMTDVLDAVLSIFNCDRAFLMYPCDPDAPSWWIPMERCRLNYPGAPASKRVTSMDEEYAETLRSLLNTDGPVTFGPEVRHTLPKEVSVGFDSQSSMSIVVHPWDDAPWQFGIHQCAGARVWSADEKRLLQEISRRLTDGLSSLLAYCDLQEREREFRTLSENAPDNIIRYDRNTRICYMNPMLERSLGLRSERAIGKRTDELFPESEIMLRYQTVLEHVIDTKEPAEFEMISGPIGGSLELYDLIRIVPELDDQGQAIGAIAIGRNYTAQKQLELELMRREQEYRTLAENSPDIIMRYDRDCHYMYMNPAYEREAGVRLEMARNKPVNEFWKPLMPCEEYVAWLNRVMSSGEPDRILLEWRGADGNLISHDMHGVAECDEKGHIIGALVIGHNITELKATERQLQESRNQLHRLTSKREEARDEERKHIAREIHDELGQLLSFLRLNVTIFDLRFGDANPNLRKRALKMLEIVDRAILMVRNIATRLRPAALDAGIVPALEWLVQGYTESTGITCTLQTSSEEIPLNETRALAVFRIVQESLTNALRHSEADCIDITLHHAAGICELEVRDNGKGFDIGDAGRPDSFGIAGMQERALKLNGTLDIVSGKPGGTTLKLRLSTDE